MKTARHLLAATLVALTLASPASAEDKTVPETDFTAYKELAQVKLDAAKESLQKDVAALGTRVDNQDKRIDQQGNRFDDISASIDRFGYLQAGFALIFGLISVGAGFLAAMTFSSRAKAEAEQAAEDWFAKKEESLMQRMANFQQKIEALEAQATAHETSMQTAASRTHEAAERYMAAMQADLSNTQQHSASMSQADSQALKTDAEQLRHKPEAAYTYPDWNIRAFAAYRNGDKSDASYLWRKAAEAPDATALNAAVALCNAGIALGHTDEAIAAYDLVDARSANDTAPTLREQVARALFNKGVALGQLGRTDKAITAYELVEARYADDTATALRELVAKALVNKGVALRQLDRTDEAIAAYEVVEARYANDTAPTVREQVARARNGKGFTLLCRAKAEWDTLDQRHADLELAARLFEQAKADNDDMPMVLGNRAYCANLRGEPVEVVRPLLTRALKDGGERLYKLSLGDLASQPVPEDAAFRALLDEVWAEVRGEDPPEAAPVPA